MQEPDPKPILKWVGGKSQFINKISDNLSKQTFKRFVEPFVGGGSVFLNILPKNVWINDINSDLINMYKIVKESPDDLIRKLNDMISEMNTYKPPRGIPRKSRKDKSLEMIRREHYFYYIRDTLDPKETSRIEQAARFIFLNKTCFRGLYRENSKGKFNVPFGNYKNPQICNAENICAVSEYLNRTNAKITNYDYKRVLDELTVGDFVYLDPPYYPKNALSFTKYNKNGFSISDHKDLANSILNSGKGFLLSNYPHPDFIKLFENKPGITYESFHAKRAINVKQGENNDKTPNELLILRSSPA